MEKKTRLFVARKISADEANDGIGVVVETSYIHWSLFIFRHVDLRGITNERQDLLLVIAWMQNYDLFTQR